MRYSDQKRWNEAEEIQVQVFEATKRILGEEHPDTLKCQSNLATIYEHQSRLVEAGAGA
jgi:hypothetical protein